MTNLHYDNNSNYLESKIYLPTLYSLSTSWPRIICKSLLEGVNLLPFFGLDNLNTAYFSNRTNKASVLSGGIIIGAKTLGSMIEEVTEVLLCVLS